MRNTEWIEKAEGRHTLTEAESKQLLKAYGVPVVPETVVYDEKEVGGAAEALGFPVVLKGIAAGITHKTEQGLVRLWLNDPARVTEAAKEMARKVGERLEGFLIQPQLTGKRELVAGLFHDPQFGPVIMFGIGGVFTEALQDVTFRTAPLTRADASEMIHEIRSKALLEDYRGEKAVNREQLLDTLTGLSDVAAAHPDIAEIDINPLIVSSEGELVAADALVVLNKTEQEKISHPPIDPYDLGALFHPKSIAFVGASATLGKWGHILFANTVSGGYEGEIYLVNPKGGTIAGRPVYPSVTDIPHKIDLAVVTVPAGHLFDLIPQFEEKGIKGMLLITSGFSETGADGRQAEEELVQKARAAGILILGPNTMGICNPHVRLFCVPTHARTPAGSTALVSQSGNLGVQLLSFAERQGLAMRAFSGSGNEAMITIEDYIDAFEKDDLTRTVVLYIESVKDGRRFLESASRVSRKKPIIILKGGCTDAGARAASSHTGAMASDARIFEAACRQGGIVMADHPMELLDLSAVFSSLPLPKGNRVAIMTLGGGWGVVAADLCAKYGLEVPMLTPEMITRFDEMLPPYWSRSNPVDLVGERDTRLPVLGLEELLKWEGCDAVINLGIYGRRISMARLAESVSVADPNYSKAFLEVAKQQMNDFDSAYVGHVVRLMEVHEKPVLGVSLVTEDDRTLYNVPGSAYKGLFFPSPERAVKALAKMCGYQRWTRRLET